MGITKLKKEVYELIAAGEIIERPASIIKELVENSIDAGSTSIDIGIKRGGKQSIRVTDNGVGIPKEDCKLAFISHATSKILFKEDLERIRTLGFRGEALASIAAISKVSMLTKPKNIENGTKYIIEGSREVSKEICGCANGTTILVEDLFYNTPARLKFLKKDSTEASYIEDIVSCLAISHPEISFTFRKDHLICIETPGNNRLHDAIYSVFGMNFAKSLMQVSYNSGGIKIKGYITKPMEARNNRKMQHFFVNNRFVKSNLLSTGLEEGYKGSVMISKFPGCVLFLNLPETELDINIHPSKTEVKFIDEHTIIEAIYTAVRKSISDFETIPKIERNKHINLKSFNNFKKSGHQTTIPTDPIPFKISNKPASKFLVASDEEKYEYNYQNNTSFKTNTPSIPIIKENFIIEETPKPIKEEIEQPKQLAIQIIGELFKTYILAQIGNNFVVVDKHAAHERIIYEELKKDKNPLESQMLIEPLHIEMTAKEKNLVFDSENIFRQFGFEFEDFGRGSIIVRSVPSILVKKDLKETFMEILQNIENEAIKKSPKTLDKAYHTIACRAAIKGNDNNSIEELTKLFNQVYYDENIRHCPHGRPVVIVYNQRDFEKKFGREQ